MITANEAFKITKRNRDAKVTNTPAFKSMLKDVDGKIRDAAKVGKNEIYYPINFDSLEYNGFLVEILEHNGFKVKADYQDSWIFRISW